MKETVKKYLPFSLTALILLLDQLTKWLVVTFLPIPAGGVYSKPMNIIGDFFRFTHVRNTAIAFGIGNTLTPTLKIIFFMVIPLIVLALVVIYYVRTKDLQNRHRWILTAILGGGLGNMIDRVFRPGGVVDFLDVRVYGLFGFERWPTFNIADSAIVVAVLILLVFLVIEEIQQKKKGKK